MTQEHPDFVTITHGMRGYFAVHLSWNSDHGGFYEPWQSGFGSYATPQEAEPEARRWAETEEIEFKAPDYEEMILGVAKSAERSRRMADLRREGMSPREAWEATRV